MKENKAIFKKDEELASIQATVMSGMTGARAKASHINEEEVDVVLNWFEYEKKGYLESLNFQEALLSSYLLFRQRNMFFGVKYIRPITNPVASPPR